MGKLRLYQVDFEPTDNFYIEDIESYLRTLPASAKREEWNNLNYLKLDMNITIKLPLNQMHQIENTCNYAIIEQDNNTYYYFVVDANWIAKGTVQLVLTLDTVQTFFPRLKWSDKTQIIRETRDRLVKLNTNYYLRKIDKYNEGFNPAKVQKVNETTINSALGGKWYLVYMSNPATTQDQTGNPMFMGLLANTSYKIYNAVSGADVKYVSHPNTITYITESASGEGAGIIGAGGKIALGTVKENKTLRAIRIIEDNALNITAELLWYTGNTYPYAFAESTPTTVIPPYTFHNIRIVHYVQKTDYNASINNLDKIDSLDPTMINAGTLPEVKTVAYRDFDNSNSRLSKIIELPYAPISITKNSDGTYNFADCSFNYGYNIMQINTDRLSTSVKEDTRLQDLLYVNITNPTSTDKPNINLESKLYSSEFYDYAYYYDTDKQPIRLEDISTNMLNCSINIYYNTTTTMNSDKQFYFAMHNATYNETQPYEMYLNCARSTEKMILNDNYAEYIKNGYNYDLWNQKQQEKLAKMNFGWNIASAVVSGIGPAVQSGKAIYSIGKTGVGLIKNIRESANNNLTREVLRGLEVSSNNSEDRLAFRTARRGVILDQAKLADARSELKSDLSKSLSSFTGIGALVINNGVNAVLSAINSNESIKSSQQNFMNSINTRANAPFGASGNVPTDLFDNYSSNKLTRFEYTMNQDERTNLFNTFRLTGYSHPVQEKPVFNTRIYSNFVQCKPVFLNSLTEIYKVYLDDISLRFQAGVTVKHNYKGKYDLYDEYENYETIVMEE